MSIQPSKYCQETSEHPPYITKTWESHPQPLWCHSDGPETYEIYCMSDLRKPSSTPFWCHSDGPETYEIYQCPATDSSPSHPCRMTTPPAAAVGANAAKRRIETCNTFKSNSTGRKYIFKITSKPWAITCKSKDLTYLLSVWATVQRISNSLWTAASVWWDNYN